MAIQTYYLLDTLANNSAHLALQEGGTPPTAATISTGWTVGTQAVGQSSSMAAQTERARATFTATEQPSDAPSGVLGDCFRTSTRLTGDFAAGVFSLALPVIAVTSGGDQDGRARLRIWRSRFPDGAAAHEITSAIQFGTGVTNLSTALQQISTVSVTLAAFALAREFLFFQIAWEIQGAGGNINRDVLLRKGLDAVILTTDLATTTYLLWTDDQLIDDLAEYIADLQTAKNSFSSNNQALLADPTNVSLRNNYATLDAARDQQRINLNPVLAEMIRRGLND